MDIRPLTVCVAVCAALLAEQLGTDYFVFTPSGGYSSMDKLVAIVNGKSQNRITILPRADVSLRNVKWTRGKAMTIRLAPYASYLLRGRTTLTGTRIQSQTPVAVLAGHQCLSMGGRCDHVYEQLPPVHSLGKEYMVPKTGREKTTNQAVIVAVEDNTELTLHSRTQKLARAGDVILQKLIYKRPLVVKSNKKVMVLLLSDNRPFDPFLITLIPTCKLSTDWAVETVGGLQNTVSILSEKEGAASVKVCWSGRCISPRWSCLLSDKQWVWSNVDVGQQQSHVRVEGDALMAVYAYGGKHRHSYGIAGVCSEAVTPPTPPPDPCEKVKCRVKERCVKGECVHVSTATCRAVGDPHYHTFDGRRFNFQGTCTYIMTTVAKKASDLREFTVTTKNDHRGNRRVSYVRTVGVTVYEQHITIGRHRSQVEVNGELHALLLPPTPGGLCGNYNGDMTDDLPEAKDSSVPTVLEMIRKWKAEDSDRFCDDNCAGRCPQCSEKQQAHFRLPRLCGVLAEANGSFSACHNQVEPSMYLDNCVYDKEVKVNPEWRMVTKCFLSCPKGSHYEACGPSCPASCSDPHSEKQCKDPCVEGCQCDQGLVISGDRCVPQKGCGCQHKGSYLPSSKAFWADNTCTTKCECIQGEAKCKSVTCKKNERCALKEGVRNCYPVSLQHAKATGDPHYRSFDQRRFDFQGTCTYVLSQIIKGSDKDLERFQVLVQNENRGRNKAVAYTKSVSLTVFDDIIVSMSRGNAGKILVRSVRLLQDVRGTS
ncbi:hypothetical protein KUCAC02_032797 [Chaenocephalus aceratus]|nr:hypothetical protein KUCAC02_032797 [Chaenocephalus aceratus]